MPLINHRQFGKTTHRHGRKPWRVVAWSLAGLAGLFVVANIGMALMYHAKALPGYSVGAEPIGGKTFAQIDSILQTQTLPAAVTLQLNSAHASVPLSNLGISIDRTKSLQAVKAKPIVPLLSLVTKHVIPITLQADSKHIAESLASYGANFSKKATGKHIGFDGKNFAILTPQPGYGFDQLGTANVIIAALGQGKSAATVATTVLPAGPNSGDLDSALADAQKQLATKITFNVGSQKASPSTADEAAWFTPSGQAGQMVALDNSSIGTYVDQAAKQLGVTAANKSDLITAVNYALTKNISMNFEIAQTGAVSRTYCTATRDVSDSELPDLIGKLAATYADVRGWNDSGKVSFQHVTSGCDYTVWLSSPAQMTSFGDICDDYYNCQVGSGVVVNNDRWLYATDPWNATGQNIETYRTLIIDHESGHRLGYYDNPTCPGAGQPAPVMMQQSIDLKGCVFNIWPLQSELDGLRTDLHVVS